MSDECVLYRQARAGGSTLAPFKVTPMVQLGGGEGGERPYMGGCCPRCTPHSKVRPHALVVTLSHNSIGWVIGNGVRGHMVAPDSEIWRVLHGPCMLIRNQLFCCVPGSRCSAISERLSVCAKRDRRVPVTHT